jgi:hypothetical protein
MRDRSNCLQCNCRFSNANTTTGGNWTGGAGTFNPDRNTANATYTPAAVKSEQQLH